MLYAPKPQNKLLKPNLFRSSHLEQFTRPIWLKNLETVDDFHIRCIKWIKSSLYIVLSG